MTYWNIFWKTFAQLALAVLIAAQGYSWVVEDFKANAAVTGWGLLGAAIGGLVAVIWAFAQTPATTALEKALRSAAEKVVGVLGALAINQAADLVDASKIIIPSVIAVVLAFLVTYFQNQEQPTPS